MIFPIILLQLIWWKFEFFFFKCGVAIGFNVETVQYNNIKFQVWDLGK